MESRLKAQLEAQEKAYRALEKKDLITTHLEDSGDAFELAARCALGAWQHRAPHYERHTVEFQVGYEVACEELALILRAMRKGGLPDLHELNCIVAVVRAESGDDTLL